MHLIISTLFVVLFFPAAPAWADGGGDITFQRMQEQAATVRQVC
ncbi:co-regulatory protein PtrA N-terminal domain-containing protein [Pseudomonas sp. CAN2814]|nr:co-regulatory protein PtrA N-terminal domain-containing protein [Pseudomonas sp. CAN1]MDN6859142.1 co-regulatory protein PtrA N-terminal domain-containing protein [Pseudomonas sp. CAN1]